MVRQGEVTLFTVKPKGPKRAVVELELDAGATNAEFIAALQAEIDRVRPNR